MYRSTMLLLEFLLLCPVHPSLSLQACGSALHDKLMEHCGEMVFPMSAAKQEMQEGGMSNDIINDVIEAEVTRKKEGECHICRSFT